MTDDLVKRLRDISDQISDIESMCEQTIADRNKLRAALIEIERLANFYTIRKSTVADAMRNIARKALEGKND